MKIKECLVTLKDGNYPALILMLLGVFVFGMFGGSKFEDGWDSARLSFSLKIGIFFVVFGFLFFMRKNIRSPWNVCRHFYLIRWWIFFSLGLFAMAYISLIFSFDAIQTAKVIVKTLLIPLILTCVFFALFRSLKKREANFSFGAMSIFFFLHVMMTIRAYWQGGNLRSVGIESYPIIGYAFFLFVLLSIALAMLVYARYKLLSVVLIAISLFALYANGTRASILSVGAMALCAVLYPKYRYKKWIVSLSFLAMLGGGVALLEWSEGQNARFNFKAMIERIGVVWSYAPAEMGRFDVLCFAPKPKYHCSSYSGDKLDPRFSFEASTLSRLALNKSALMIVLNNPWKPHGYYQQFFNRNMPLGLDRKYYFYALDHEGKIFYNAIHNSFLSAFFEMGIVGGVLYFLKYISLLFLGSRQRNFYGAILTFIVIASGVQDAFDVPFSYLGILYVFSSFVGILLGRIFSYEGKENENSI